MVPGAGVRSAFGATSPGTSTEPSWPLVGVAQPQPHGALMEQEVPSPQLHEPPVGVITGAPAGASCGDPVPSGDTRTHTPVVALSPVPAPPTVHAVTLSRLS